MTPQDFATTFAGKRVLVTGHTGFKGSWLCLWLDRLGAQVTGYALDPPTDPSLFVRARIAERIDHRIGDVRDGEALARVVAETRPDFVFHLAAQPLVLDSYSTAAETFAINLGGTINLMEALRGAPHPVAAVMVATDKVYRNREWAFGYREDDPLGGHDPYSASKAAMEIAVASWRDSFFAGEGRVRMASARAGNVIGGGDWASRIVPDIVRALLRGNVPAIRRPHSQRPWQHVLEPLAGYLHLAARLAGESGASFAQAWNFGPLPSEVRTVGELASAACRVLGEAGWEPVGDAGLPHEAGLLRLAIDKAVGELGWRPAWGFEETVKRTIAWYRAVELDGADARAACLADLAAFEAAVAAR